MRNGAAWWLPRSRMALLPALFSPRETRRDATSPRGNPWMPCPTTATSDACRRQAQARGSLTRGYRDAASAPEPPIVTPRAEWWDHNVEAPPAKCRLDGTRDDRQ